MKWYRRIFILFWRQAREYFGPEALPEAWATLCLTVIAMLNLISIARIAEHVLEVMLISGLSQLAFLSVVGFIYFIIYSRLAAPSRLKKMNQEFGENSSLLLARMSALAYLICSLVLFWLTV